MNDPLLVRKVQRLRSVRQGDMASRPVIRPPSSNVRKYSCSNKVPCTSSSVLLHPMSQEFWLNMANDVREALSRVIGLESRIASANMSSVSSAQFSSVTQDILLKVSVLVDEVVTVRSEVQTARNEVQTARSEVQTLRTEVKTLQATVNSTQSSTNHTLGSSGDSSQSSFTDFCAFANCNENLSHNKRPCSAVMSMRHMLECPCCPPDVSRVTFILSHMSNFGRAPQVTSHTFTQHNSRLTHPTPVIWSRGLLLLLRNGNDVLVS